MNLEPAPKTGRSSKREVRERTRGRHPLALVSAVLVVVAIVFVVIGYRNATAPPIARHLNLRIGANARPQERLRLVLFSDVHVHGPDMRPKRLERIVQEINRERPDIVIAAGDFVGNNLVGDNYSIADSVAPLAELKSRLGVYAVLGNNDHMLGPKKVARALSAVHVRLLENEAIRVGPIVLGGVDYRLDEPRSEALGDVETTLALMQKMHGMRVMVAHSPDVFPTALSSVSLVLAGHTHCGQIALPLFGPVLTGSHFGREFACGAYRRKNSLLIVTGGLGTSHVPLRFEAPPDFWVIDIQGA